MPIRTMNARKRIALVAHDNKKQELIEWALQNKAILAKHRLYGTGTTGTMIENALDQSVNKFLSGPLGGDQQIGAAVAEGNIDMVIFFFDPMEAQPHDPDIKALLRLAAVWNIPIATTRSTADFLLSSPLMNEDYECLIMDFSSYIKRTIETK